MAFARFEPDRANGVQRGLAGVRSAGKLQGQHHIFQCAER